MQIFIIRVCSSRLTGFGFHILTIFALFILFLSIPSYKCREQSRAQASEKAPSIWLKFRKLHSGKVRLGMMVYADSKRCEIIARYMIENGATVRAAAVVFGISKSTVHKDVTRILERENKSLYLEVKKLLETNKSERHMRGGEATRMKYIIQKAGQREN